MVDVMTIDTLSPNVFDVAWPTFAYQDAPDPDPDDAHDIIRRAQQQAPIALGPYGPEVLSYDLVRTVLRGSPIAGSNPRRRPAATSRFRSAIRSAARSHPRRSTQLRSC